MRRCCHKWAEVGRHFTAPPDNVKAKWSSVDLVRDLAFGVTQVELRCESCGDLKFVRVVGDAREAR